MPYGMSSSQDIYQKKIDQAFDKCKGAFAIADISRFMAMIPTMICTCMKQWRRTRQAGLKLNYDKCVIKTKSCTFFGNVYTPQGVMPDPKKG